MIRFCCEHCAHKLSVKDEHAGKRGRCPACKKVLTVPEKTILVNFLCEQCGQRISAPSTRAGKEGTCPKCKTPLVVPAAHNLTLLDVGEEYRLEDRPASPPVESEVVTEREQEDKPEGEQDESRAKRKLPWIIDIFLYPANASGLIHVAVFVIVPMVLKLVNRVFSLGPRHYGGRFTVLFYILFLGYVLSYLIECIRDSAGGQRRASDPPDFISSRDEFLEQWAVWLACYAFFFGPATFYRGYVYFCDVENNNAILWPLLAYGILFFPMGILAATMFDSVSGLNPILLIGSIAATFLQYCGLIICLACLGLLRVGLSMLSSELSWGILANVLPDLLFMWLLLVAVHLIGRFYWRHQDKLNWEV